MTEADRKALPERDPAKTNQEQGLYGKFDIRRVDGSDGPGGKHEGCEYFALDLTHDKHAVAALAAYADACEATHPLLAADLRQRYALAHERATHAAAPTIDPLQNPKRPGYFMNYGPDETPAEMVLRKLACWLGVGGYNAPTVDADLFHDKIIDGVNMLLASAGASAIREAVEAEREAQTQDAARYRWLRDSSRIDGDADGHLITGPACGEDVLWGEQLDRTIDAAIRSRAPKEPT